MTPFRFPLVATTIIAAIILFVIPALADDFTTEQERLLAEAQASVAANPEDADALVWVGRRLGYLGRLNEAMAIFVQGQEKFPNDARFPRHLGHRLISVRSFADAEVALLSAADLMAARPNEIEPDGLPNEAGIPTSTLKGNIYYHLALAHYLQGDFGGAAEAWAGAVAIAANKDAAAASRYWLYLARARGGDMAAAMEALGPVRANWALLENHDYQSLGLCFKAEGAQGQSDCSVLEQKALSVDSVGASTLLYGLGTKALIDGDEMRARLLYNAAIATGAPTSFGYIAAQIDLAVLDAKAPE